MSSAKLEKFPMRGGIELREGRIGRLIQLAESRTHCCVKDLAAAVNLTPSRLEHLFKRETGGQIRQYLMNMRLLKAAHLLEATELPVKAIAFAVGYGHTSSFVRAFRRRYAASPGNYRRVSASRPKSDESNVEGLAS
jgi:AraC family transcriptional regulator of arabinose operon